MTPAQNVYHSDYDDVDGLDPVVEAELREHLDHGSVFQDEMDAYDDGQPTLLEEMQDYYGGDDWDHGQFDTPEDWSI